MIDLYCPHNHSGNFFLDCLRAAGIDYYYNHKRGFKNYISFTHLDCINFYGRKSDRLIKRLCK